MTLTIDIPEKVVERAKELGVPVNKLVSETLNALAADEDHRPPPMLGSARPHRVPPFSGPTVFTKAEHAEIAEMEARNEAYSARFKGRPDLALQELVAAGFCHPDGQLTEHYR